MEITTGKENYKIIDSGTVITFKDEPITFHLAPDFLVSMIFKNDPNIKGQTMEYKLVEKIELQIIIFNFNSSLGTGNAEPLPVGKLNNKRVYVNFNVYAFNETSAKTMHYTWYLREEFTNG